jgi:hypothetical protein
MSEIKKIIGKTIKLGEIEVAEFDFPDAMNFYDAKTACENLGENWRLPDISEMQEMYINKHAIGGFTEKDYWGADESLIDEYKDDEFWMSFYDGNWSDGSAYNSCNVRAVRDI